MVLIELMILFFGENANKNFEVKRGKSGEERKPKGSKFHIVSLKSIAYNLRAHLSVEVMQSV